MKKLAFFLILIHFCFFSAAQAAMNDYCVIPTPSSSVAKPNILIVMDHSGSMQFPAYLACNNFSYKTSHVADCSDITSAETYDKAKNYYGVFDNTKYYKHDGTKFLINTSCSDDTTQRRGSIGGDPTTACIAGNLLNWVTATRVDVSRQVLTGRGKTTGTTDVFQSEGAEIGYTDTTMRCKFTISTTTGGVRQLAVSNQTGYTCPL